METRSLLENVPNATGVYGSGNDAVIEILEPRTRFEHDRLEAAYPDRKLFEKGFVGGPVYRFSVTNGICDVETGAVFDRDGRLIVEAFGTPRLVENYAAAHERPGRETIEAGSGPFLPLANMRQANYCRWWLDSLSKLSLAKRNPTSFGEARILSPKLKTTFQKQSAELFPDFFPVEASAARYVRGNIVSSAGVTFGGGQSIGSIVSDVAKDFVAAFSARSAETTRRTHVYVTRRNATIRRVVDEERLVAELEKLGFATIDLAELTLQDQFTLFRNAEAIVSPHGAGLTNLLWAKPNTRILEMFPDGGVHGSAFLRLSRHLDLRHYAFVGSAAGNRDRRNNPNNSDIEVPVDVFCDFVRRHLV